MTNEELDFNEALTNYEIFGTPVPLKLLKDLILLHTIELEDMKEQLDGRDKDLEESERDLRNERDKVRELESTIRDIHRLCDRHD